MQDKLNKKLEADPKNTHEEHLSPITCQLSGLLKSMNNPEEIEEAHHVWQMLKESLSEFESDFQIER